jgi:hypothetical protein
MCPAGWSGVTCQTDVDECSSQPCANGATCVDAINYFTCSCVAGFSGSNWYVLCRLSVALKSQTAVCSLCSQTEINECQSQPCLNGGTCVDQINRFDCQCVAGYTGAQCQTDVNECSSQPCRNGATCVDLVNAYACTCVLGLTGTMCQTNLNECQSLPCTNGGTCIDQVNGYLCQCRPGFSGLNW